MPDGRAARWSYDRVAARYAAEVGGELDGKPLDRALLDAVVELAAGRPIADLGCGPGHVGRYLARRTPRVVGVDLSPAMATIAAREARVAVCVGDLTALPLASESIGAVVCLYAVIHLDRAQRQAAYSEVRRVLRAGGAALIAFHTSDAETATGRSRTMTQWWGDAVDLVFHFLDPAEEVELLDQVGLELMARLDRRPIPQVEHASGRTYLVVRRA